MSIFQVRDVLFCLFLLPPRLLAPAASSRNNLSFPFFRFFSLLTACLSLESGSDYTIRVKDESSEAEHTSPEFTVLGTPGTYVEVTSPDG